MSLLIIVIVYFFSYKFILVGKYLFQFYDFIGKFTVVLIYDIDVTYKIFFITWLYLDYT